MLCPFAFDLWSWWKLALAVIFMRKSAKEDRALPSLPATIKGSFSHPFVCLSANLLFGWPTHQPMLFMVYCYWRRYVVSSNYFLSMQLWNCEMVLVLLDCTRNWGGRCVFHARFCRGFTWRQRREKLRATSYLQNFSSWHACSLHSKCLLLVASCDQSRNSSLHLLTQLFSPNLICSPDCFCFIYVWWWSESCWLPFQNLVSSTVAFRWCSCIITHQAVADWYCAAMPNTMGPHSAKTSVMTRLSGEYSR